MPLINQEQFQALCDLADGDAEFIASVIDAFLPQLEETPEQIRSDLAAGDAEAAAKHAHSLKGSSANVGAEQVSEICKQIEEAARQGDLSGVGAQLEALVTAAGETRDFMTAEKAKLG